MLLVEVWLVLVCAFVAIQGVCLRSHYRGAVAAVWLLDTAICSLYLRTIELETLLDAESLSLRCFILSSLLSLDITKDLECISEIFLVMHQCIGIPGCQKVLVVMEAELSDQIPIISRDV